jgi:hypothetical protein
MITTNDLIKSFIGLDDDAKQRVIEQLKKEGYPKSDIAGLVWLASMSNNTTKELMFNSLNPTL